MFEYYRRRPTTSGAKSAPRSRPAESAEVIHDLEFIHRLTARRTAQAVLMSLTQPNGQKEICAQGGRPSDGG